MYVRYEYIEMCLLSLHSVVNWGVCPWRWIGSAFCLAIISLELEFISILGGTIKIRYDTVSGSPLSDIFFWIHTILHDIL